MESGCKMAEKIKGMDNLLKAFGNLAIEIDKSQEKAIKLAANAYKNDVQKLAPFKTGTYRRSIHVEMVAKDKALVGTGLPQSKILEYGGVIKAKNGPYLKFKVGGHWVQVKQVQRTAQPHFRPAMDDNRGKYEKIYKEALFS